MLVIPAAIISAGENEMRRKVWKERTDEERLARSRAITMLAECDTRIQADLSHYSLGIYTGEMKYTVHLNSDPVLPIMPVNGPFALVVARVDALRVEPHAVLSDRSNVFGTPDIPMIQSKLPSRINKDVLPSNKKKMHIKVLAICIVNAVTLSRYLKALYI